MHSSRGGWVKNRRFQPWPPPPDKPKNGQIVRQGYAAARPKPLQGAEPGLSSRLGRRARIGTDVRLPHTRACGDAIAG